MKKKEYTEPTSGALTEQMDTTSDEFIRFQALLLKKSRAQSEEQKLKNQLMGLQFQMEDYLNSTGFKQGKLKLAGEFLRSFLDTLNIKQKNFAAYIEIRPSNLSKMLNGERPINPETALKLEKIFHTRAIIWLEIQSKNELIQLSKIKNKELKKYSLNNLIKENMSK